MRVCSAWVDAVLAGSVFPCPAMCLYARPIRRRRRRPILPPLAPGEVLRIGQRPVRNHRGLRHRCHRPCASSLDSSQLLQVCGTASPVGGVEFGGWYAPVAARRSQVDRRSGRGALHRCHRRRHAALYDPRRLETHSCPPVWCRSTAAIPDGDHHQGPAANRIPAWCGPRRRARRLAQTVSGGPGATPPPTRTAGELNQRILRPGFPRPIRQLGGVYIVAATHRGEPALLSEDTESFTDRSRWQELGGRLTAVGAAATTPLAARPARRDEHP